MNTNRKIEEPVYVGICDICDRPLVEGQSSDRHHWIPQLKGGKNGPVSLIHRMCHSKLHSIWSEAELARTYNNPEIVKNAPEMQEFLAWIRKKAPDFYTTTKLHNSRRKKR